MRDPHVTRLYFQITAEEGIAYRNPAPLSFTNNLGKFETQKQYLIVEPTEHFASEDEARTVIEAYLRSWEIEGDLAFDLGAIRFVFERAEVIDRNPPPPGSHSLIAGTARFAITGMPVMLTITRSSFPPPPRLFRTSPEVLAAYQRWRNVRLGREPLPGMAYWLLTLVESMAGGRRPAATTFNIEPGVLDTLGRLSSTRGDLTHSRKVKAGPAQDLTAAERNWLEQAVKQVIRRLGEHGSGSTVPRVLLKALPPV
jgi:hypothetical protein